jgi:hypothetical protein
MAKAREVIEWLSKLDPEETIALTGWWLKSDIENNHDITLTDDEWELIADTHENNTEIHIDEQVSRFLREELN